MGGGIECASTTQSHSELESSLFSHYYFNLNCTDAAFPLESREESTGEFSGISTRAVGGVRVELSGGRRSGVN